MAYIAPSKELALNGFVFNCTVVPHTHTVLFRCYGQDVWVMNKRAFTKYEKINNARLAACEE